MAVVSYTWQSQSTIGIWSRPRRSTSLRALARKEKWRSGTTVARRSDIEESRHLEAGDVGRLHHRGHGDRHLGRGHLGLVDGRAGAGPAPREVADQDREQPPASRFRQPGPPRGIELKR